MNGLTLDRHSEEKAVELFSQSIIHAGGAFLQNPQLRPVIPSWSRVISADTDILPKIHDAVEADNQEGTKAQEIDSTQNNQKDQSEKLVL